MAQENELEGNLYKDTFDPIHSQQDDRDLLGLGSEVDMRQEKLRSFQARLQDFRPLLLPASHFLEWRQPWFPAVIAGVNTLFFLLIWYLDLSVLSILALLGTLITFADGIIPIVGSALFANHNWTADQEQDYDVLCNRLLDLKNCLPRFCTYISGVKAQLPRVFSIGLCGVFIVLAIFFNKVNNFFLAYVATTFLLLAPGLHARGVLALAQHHTRELVHKIRNRKTVKQN